MSITYNGIHLANRLGDITRQEDMEAIVNAANAQLRTGGGVAGAIHRAAGPELEREAVKLAPIKPGQAVITKGYLLPNSYVIHCLGPVYGRDRPEAVLLGDCYQNALKLADQHKIKSIAFPAISTGVFGYPVREAAHVAFGAVASVVPDLKFVKKIYFVLFGEEDFDIHEAELTKIKLSEQ